MRYKTSFALVLMGIFVIVWGTPFTPGQDRGGFGGGGPGFPGKGKGGFGGFGPGKGKKGFGGGGPGGFGQRGFQGPAADSVTPRFAGPRGGNPVDNLSQRAESDFYLRDRNGDGFLNMDEMPPDLKVELGRWDTNRDNLVSLDEYKAYYVARAQTRRGSGNQQDNSVIVITEDESLDARPVVYRVGKLPKNGLPDWFKPLDLNRDGQVALSEWYKAGKDIDEFGDWDRNDDGFITPEEAMHKLQLLTIASAKLKPEDAVSPADTMQANPGFGGQGRAFGGPGLGKNGNKGAKGGNRKGKRGNG
jgi:hypothetical protein